AQLLVRPPPARSAPSGTPRGRGRATRSQAVRIGRPHAGRLQQVRVATTPPDAPRRRTHTPTGGGRTTKLSGRGRLCGPGPLQRLVRRAFGRWLRSSAAAHRTPPSRPRPTLGRRSGRSPRPPRSCPVGPPAGRAGRRSDTDGRLARAPQAAAG